MEDDIGKLIQEVIDEIIQDYEDDIATALEKRDARLRELDSIFENARKSASASFTASAGFSARATVLPVKVTVTKGAKPGFAEIARNIIQETDGTFDKNYIEKQIKKAYPELAVRLGERTVPNILRRLKQQEKIVEVEVGTGRRPSKYRKAAP